MATLKTTNIKGKQYVEVNVRLKYFREHFAGYSLETEPMDVNDATALMRAVIRNPEGRIVATGMAFERKDNAASMVNITSHVENCETSAWGRALANFGIGIDSSVASADEVRMAIDDARGADATDGHGEAPAPAAKQQQPAKAAEQPRPQVATASIRVPVPAPKKADQEKKAKAASPAQQNCILKLAAEIGLDVQRDLYAPRGITAPTSQQASILIDHLRALKASPASRKGLTEKEVVAAERAGMKTA